MLLRMLSAARCGWCRGSSRSSFQHEQIPFEENSSQPAIPKSFLKAASEAEGLPAPDSTTLLMDQF